MKINPLQAHLESFRFCYKPKIKSRLLGVIALGCDTQTLHIRDLAATYRPAKIWDDGFGFISYEMENGAYQRGTLGYPSRNENFVSWTTVDL
jgi:hypothetical protein